MTSFINGPFAEFTIDKKYEKLLLFANSGRWFYLTESYLTNHILLFLEETVKNALKIQSIALKTTLKL